MSLSKKPAVSREKIPSLLNLGLDHKLLGYAAAAGAAGVSLLALAQPSEAEIVYTATNVMVHGSLALDLNNDGITDFTIVNSDGSCSIGPECLLEDLTVSPNPPNRVVTTYGGRSFAQALSLGRKVGAGDNFGSQFIQMERCKSTRTSYYASGSWFNVKNRYLGLSFSIDGQTHYGWARLSVKNGKRDCTDSVILTGYAYETEPGKPIAAGKRSGPDKVSAAAPRGVTLGALALGNMAFAPWRREEEDAN
jgi:hypothetical protein